MDGEEDKLSEAYQINWSKSVVANDADTKNSSNCEHAEFENFDGIIDIQQSSTIYSDISKHESDSDNRTSLNEDKPNHEYTSHPNMKPSDLTQDSDQLHKQSVHFDEKVTIDSNESNEEDEGIFSDDEDSEHEEIDDNEDDEDYVNEDLDPDKDVIEARSSNYVFKRKMTQSKSTLDKLKKRQRVMGKQFLDVEAAVGDDDEFDEDDEENVDTFNEASAAQAAEKELDLAARRRIMGDLDKTEYRDSVSHLASTIGDLERRYQHQEFESETEDIVESDHEEEFPSYYKIQAESLTHLMADIQNVKLWSVPTQKGYTGKEIVVTIMNKAIHYFEKKLPFPILSVFAANGIKNRIYVEADSMGEVIECLSGLESVYINNIKIVPSHEISIVYSMGAKLKKVLAPNELVRFRGGLYAGDLGQIVEYDDIASSATVRLVPRIDLEDVTIELRGGEIELGPTIGTFRFGGKLFEDTGFLLRKVQPKNFVSGDDVEATKEEIKIFTENIDERDAAKLTAMINKLTSNFTNYSIGDSVVFQSADLAGLKGRVVTIDDKSVSVMIDALNKEIMAGFNEIVKSFDLGDSVKVIAGTHKGKSGLVTNVNVESGIATIFWPELGCSIDSYLNDLQQCPNSGFGLGGLSTLSGFSVDDLVLLHNQHTGVIIRIDPGGAFSVITTENKVEKLDSSQIISKRSNAFAYALDVSKNQFGVKASVLLIEKPYKNQTGRVKHIWKDHIFVKLMNKDLVNGGYFVCRGQDLRVSALEIPSSQQTSLDFMSQGQNQKAIYGHHQNFHHNRRRNNSSFHARDNRPRNIGSRVKLIGTRYKGSYGKIIAVIDNDTYRISLDNVSVVDVNKNEILLLDSGRNDTGRNHKNFQNRNNLHWNTYFDSIKRKPQNRSLPPHQNRTF